MIEKHGILKNSLVLFWHNDNRAFFTFATHCPLLILRDRYEGIILVFQMLIGWLAKKDKKSSKISTFDTILNLN